MKYFLTLQLLIDGTIVKTGLHRALRAENACKAALPKKRAKSDDPDIDGWDQPDSTASYSASSRWQDSGIVEALLAIEVTNEWQLGFFTLSDGIIGLRKSMAKPSQDYMQGSADTYHLMLYDGVLGSRLENGESMYYRLSGYQESGNDWASGFVILIPPKKLIK